VGAAAAYTTAGGADELGRLRVLAGACAPDLAVGAALAAYMRSHEGDVVERTRIACEQLCDAPLEEVVEGAERTLGELGDDRTTEAHGVWRARVRDWLDARFRTTV
jgi:hypothetical protein